MKATSGPKEEAMNLIHSLIGRRQFLVAFISSTLTLAFGRAARAFDLIFKTNMARASEKPAAGERKSIRGIVVYYSATGNTAQVAEALWRGMRSVIPCDLAPIGPASRKKVKPADMAKYDVIAIGAPNWYKRVPGNVLVFTHDMPRMDGKHCIIFGTHGGQPYAQFWIMSKNILKKGMVIIGWSDWYGSDFLTPHSSVPDGEWGHPDSIDLAEAEAFGRKMAENSIRIYAGERDLLPDSLPTPELGANSLWAPNEEGVKGKITFPSALTNAIPNFDFTKCVYPRCNRCIENCPVSAIDFSVIAPLNSVTYKTLKTKTDSPIVLKEACQQCGGLCEKVCTYGAISYIGATGEIFFQKIDMTKCTYPKCTACMDWCPQNAIDVTKNPPVVYNWCDKESLCFGVCPENAIGLVPGTMFELAGQRMGLGSRGSGEMGERQGQRAGGPGEGMVRPEERDYVPRFRNLVQEGGVKKGQVGYSTVYPRIPMYEKLWAYHMDDEG
jgi:ferredoxin/flavodoxin